MQLVVQTDRIKCRQRSSARCAQTHLQIVLPCCLLLFLPCDELCHCTELMQLSMTGVSVLQQGTGEKAWSMDMANV